MITTGFTLACLSAAGFYMVFRHLPRRVRKFMQKHALFTDAVACLMTYMLFGGTLVALFAAAWMGILVSTLLALTANPSTAAMMERWACKIGELKDGFIRTLENMTPDAPETKECEEPSLKAI